MSIQPWLKLREDLPDTSLKASVADLLDALQVAQRERDAERVENRKLTARLDQAQRRLCEERNRMQRLVVALRTPRQRRRRVVDERQMPLFDEGALLGLATERREAVIPITRNSLFFVIGRWISR